MNAADLARLELAKRAYRSTEPSATEVQRGVRKARLGLRRPRTRSTWLTKTVVGVVLAMGGLAFAKPQAVGELVETAWRSAPSAPKRGSGSIAAPTEPVAQRPAANPAQPAKVAPATARVAPAPTPVAAGAPLPPSESAKPPVVHQLALSTSEPAAPAEEAPASSAAQPFSKRAASSGAFPDAAASKATHASDWGRVGAALARGDEARALAVLDQLSASDDRRTRDKADLGRAQLLMSNGNREQACATARSLTNRGAGSRIERQAQVLLKSCQR